MNEPTLEPSKISVKVNICWDTEETEMDSIHDVNDLISTCLAKAGAKSELYTSQSSKEATIVISRQAFEEEDKTTSPEEIAKSKQDALDVDAGKAVAVAPKPQVKQNLIGLLKGN